MRSSNSGRSRSRSVVRPSAISSSAKRTVTRRSPFQPPCACLAIADSLPALQSTVHRVPGCAALLLVRRSEHAKSCSFGPAVEAADGSVSEVEVMVYCSDRGKDCVPRGGDPTEQSPESMPPSDDLVLITAYLAGDVGAFDTLFQRYHARVRAVCLRYVGDES